MIDWSDLDCEVQCWSRQELSITMWWRDDDASSPSRKLDRLLALSIKLDVPVALAVIPDKIDHSLGQTLASVNNVCVLQHGFSHANYAPDGQPQDEYGPERTLSVRLAELVEGRRRITTLLKGFVPILVPPWNRIPVDLVTHLPKVGLYGISTWGARQLSFLPAYGVQQFNVHVDIMNWERYQFCGYSQVLGQLIHHLRTRRLVGTDCNEPIGLMTHHIAHDEAAWSFLSEFLEYTRAYPNVHWLSIADVFHEIEKKNNVYPK